MGTYVYADIAYGITITEPEYDWDAPYDEDAPEPEPIDFWDLTNEYQHLNYAHAADSNWDDESCPDVVYVKGSRIHVGEEAAVGIPGVFPDIAPEALTELYDITQRISGKDVSAPGWILYWSRG